MNSVVCVCVWGGGRCIMSYVSPDKLNLRR